MQASIGNSLGEILQSARLSAAFAIKVDYSYRKTCTVLIVEIRKSLWTISKVSLICFMTLPCKVCSGNRKIER